MDPTMATVLRMETLFRQPWKPTSSDRTSTPILKYFSIFAFLPTELRLKIWNLALMEGRIVQVDAQQHLRRSVAGSQTEETGLEDYLQCVSRSSTPVLLHACTESRTAALGPGKYELAFGGADGQHSDALPTIYFNFALDTVHFSSVPIKLIGSSIERFQRPIDIFEQHVPVDQIQRIRSIALDLRPSNAKLAMDHLHSKARDGIWLALKVVSLDAELFTKLEFWAGVELVDASKEWKGIEEELQVYGRVFTGDKRGAAMVGKVKPPGQTELAGYGNLKMFLSRNNEEDLVDLVSHVLDCGFQQLHVVD